LLDRQVSRFSLTHYRPGFAEPLRRSTDPFVRQVLQPLAGRSITLPERFLPDVRFIAWHRRHLFVDSTQVAG